MKTYIKRPFLACAAVLSLMLVGRVSASTISLSDIDITSQPTNQTVECGAAATMTVSATDIEPMSYQWTFSGTNITDATDTSLTLSPASISDSGSYTVIITDGTDTATSQVALLTVEDTNAPVITLVGAAETNVECSAGFTDPGATVNDTCAGAGLSITTSGSLVAGSIGTYVLSYVATDPSGNSATNTRTVVMVDTNAPAMTVLGDNPATVWQFAPFTDPGATANDDCAGSLTVTSTGSVTVSTLGTYTLSYSATGSTSIPTGMTREVIVTKAPAIYFTTQPDSVAVNLGGEVSFTSLATVTNSTPIKYQWYFKSGAGLKKGKTTPSFSIAKVSVAEAGSYYVTASTTIPKVGRTAAITYSTNSLVAVLSINTSTLTVNIAGYGTTAPAGSALFGKAQNNAVLYVGHSYSIKASPAPGNVFANWEEVTPSETTTTPGVGNAAGKDLELTFTMESNLVLTANFVTNPFVANGEVGAYNGLFFAGHEYPCMADSTGFIKSWTVKSNGTYSGKIEIAGFTYSIAGTFDLNGDDEEIVNRSSHSLSNLYVFVNLSNDGTPNTGYIEGGVASFDGTNEWEAYLEVEQTTEAPDAMAQYTMLIPPGYSCDSPPGFGFATITNNNTKTGNVTIVGKLADGTAFNESLAMDYYTDVPIYIPLNGGKGLLAGWIELDDGPGTIGALSWFKPGGLATPLTYPKGFTNQVEVLGACYVPVPGEPAVYINDGMASVTGVTNFGTPFCFPISVNDIDQIVDLPGPTTNAFSGSITFKNGLFTAKFRPTGLGAKKDVTCYGAVLQGFTRGYTTVGEVKLNLGYLGLGGAGYFLGTTNTGSIILDGGL